MSKARSPVEVQNRATSLDFGADPDERTELVERYLALTRTVMPALASTSRHDWPVVNDHCFQRIVLDNLCGGVWYSHIARPAYKHLNIEQARAAVALCEGIIEGRVDFAILNRQSLAWRGKLAKIRTAL